jgi:hypothetical protein
MVLRSLGGSRAQCNRGLLVCPLGIVLTLMEPGCTPQGTTQCGGGQDRSRERSPA